MLEFLFFCRIFGCRGKEFIESSVGSTENIEDFREELVNGDFRGKIWTDVLAIVSGKFKLGIWVQLNGVKEFNDLFFVVMGIDGHAVSTGIHHRFLSLDIKFIMANISIVSFGGNKFVDFEGNELSARGEESGVFFGGCALGDVERKFGFRNGFWLGRKLHFRNDVGEPFVIFCFVLFFGFVVSET